MKRKLQIKPKALHDVMGVADYIAKDDLAASIRFAEAFEQTLAFLQDFPESGELWMPRKSKYSGVRIWPVKGFPNHLILFLPAPEKLEIIRVVHGAQDLEGLSLN